MREPSRVDFQVKHYRELAQIALDCARKSTKHRAQYQELAKQWSARINLSLGGDLVLSAQGGAHAEP